MTFDLQPLRARETEYLVVSLAVFAGGQGAVAGFVPALETCSFLEPIEDDARTIGCAVVHFFSVDCVTSNA